MAFKDNAVELEERVVAINRVTKVVKGGRRLRFAALVVVGDRNGRVDLVLVKLKKSQKQSVKAIEDAKKNDQVPMVGTTIPHSNISIWWNKCIGSILKGWGCCRWCSSCRCRIGRYCRCYI